MQVPTEKKRSTRRVTEYTEDESSSSASLSDYSTESSEEQPSRITARTRRLQVRRIGKARNKTKRIRKVNETPHYQVQIVIKEQQINAIADTGADISIISTKLASSLQLPLHHTKSESNPLVQRPCVVPVTTLVPSCVVMGSPI